MSEPTLGQILVQRLRDLAFEFEADVVEEKTPKPLEGVELRREVARVCGASSMSCDWGLIGVQWSSICFYNFRPDENATHLAFALMAAPEQFRIDYSVRLEPDYIFIINQETTIAFSQQETICRIITEYGGK